MPYRVSGTSVQKRDERGRWVLVKRHESADKARAHLRALYANVRDAGDAVRREAK